MGHQDRQDLLDLLDRLDLLAALVVLDNRALWDLKEILVLPVLLEIKET